MRQTHPARDTECPWWSGESCFTASKATLSGMVIRQNWAAASSAPKVLKECRWNQVKCMGHRSKEKLNKKATEEQIKTLKERRSRLLSAPASLRHRNSSQESSCCILYRQFQCQVVINAWIISSLQTLQAYSQNVKTTEKQTDVESIHHGNISNIAT